MTEGQKQKGNGCLAGEDKTRREEKKGKEMTKKEERI